MFSQTIWERLVVLLQNNQCSWHYNAPCDPLLMFKCTWNVQTLAAHWAACHLDHCNVTSMFPWDVPVGSASKLCLGTVSHICMNGITRELGTLCLDAFNIFIKIVNGGRQISGSIKPDWVKHTAHRLSACCLCPPSAHMLHQFLNYRCRI